MKNDSLSQNLLAENIRRIRLIMKWSQMKLAEKCNLSTNFISDLETGKVWVSAETLDKICKSLETSPEVLFKKYDAQKNKTDQVLFDYINRIEVIHTKLLDDLKSKIINQ